MFLTTWLNMEESNLTTPLAWSTWATLHTLTVPYLDVRYSPTALDNIGCGIKPPYSFRGLAAGGDGKIAPGVSSTTDE